MSARQNKKRKGRNNVNTRERTVTTLTEDPNTPFLVPTTTEEPAGSPMATPFTPSSAAGQNSNSNPNMSPSQSFVGDSTNNARLYPSSVALPPGKNDLEVLEKLKEMIKNGQHEFYRAVPQPAALASVYLGPNHQQQEHGSNGTTATGNSNGHNNSNGRASGTASFPPSPYDTANISSSDPLPSPIPTVDTQNRRPPRIQNKEAWDRDRGPSITANSPITPASAPGSNAQNQNNQSRGSFSGNNSNSKISSSFAGVKSGSDLRSPLDAKVLAPAPAPNAPSLDAGQRSRYDGNGSGINHGSTYNNNDAPRGSWGGSSSSAPGDDNRNSSAMPPPPLPSSANDPPSNVSSNSISSLPNRPATDSSMLHHHRDSLSRSGSGSFSNEANGRYVDRERDRDYRDSRDRDPRDGPRDPRDGSSIRDHRDSRDVIMRGDSRDSYLPPLSSSSSSSSSSALPIISPRDVDRSRPDYRFRERNELMRREREAREREARERDAREREARGRPTAEQRHHEPSYNSRRDDNSSRPAGAGDPVRSSDDRAASTTSSAPVGPNDRMDVDRRPVVIKSEEGASRPLGSVQPPSAPLEERLGLRTVPAQAPASTVSLQDRISGSGAPTGPARSTGGGGNNTSLEDRLTNAPSVPTGPAALNNSLPTALRPPPPSRDDRGSSSLPPRNGLPPIPVTSSSDDRRYSSRPITPPHDRGLPPRAPPATSYPPTQPRSASLARDLPPKSGATIPPLSPQRSEYRPSVPASIPPRPSAYRPDDRPRDERPAYDDRRNNDHMDVDRAPAYPRRFSPPPSAGYSSSAAPPASTLPVRPVAADVPYDPERDRRWAPQSGYASPYGRGAPSSQPPSREWPQAEEDSYSRVYDRDRGMPPISAPDRERFDRDRDGRFVDPRDTPPASAGRGWETREERDRRAAIDGPRASFDRGGGGGAGLPPAPLSARMAGGDPYSDDRGRPYTSSIAPSSLPPAPRRYPPTPGGSPPPYNRVRQRSPSPIGRRPTEDMRPPPMKRAREDPMPYAPSAAPSYYSPPHRRVSSASDYPPPRGNTPPPGNGSGYYDRGLPPVDSRDYPPRDGYAPPPGGGSYERDRRQLPPPSPPRGQGQYSRGGYASGGPPRGVPDARDDQRYLRGPGPRP